MTKCPKYDPYYKKQSTSTDKTDKPKSSSKQQDKKKSKDSDDDDNVNFSGIVEHEANISTHKSNIWVVDTGATNHMSNDIGDFINYVELESDSFVRFGGKEKGAQLGTGDVVLRSLVDGSLKTLTLRDVLYVPSLRRKLLSVPSVTDKGISEVISKDHITL